MIGHIKDTLTMKIAIILDPIESIDIKKDTSFAIMLEAQSRNWEIYYLQIADIIQKLDGVYALSEAKLSLISVIILATCVSSRSFSISLGSPRIPRI